MAGDLGLESSYGLSALQQMIRQRIADQLHQKQQEFENQITMRGANRADAQLAETSALRRAQEAETARQHQASEADRLFREDQTLNESIPGGTDVTDTSPVFSRLQRVGALSPKPIQADVPASLAADGATSVDVPGTVSGGPITQGRVFRKDPTAKQQDTTTDNARQAAALKQAGELQDWKTSIQQQLADAKAASGPTSSYQLQPELDPKTGQQTGRFLGYNTKANRWEPVQGQGPGATKAAPGASQTAQHEQSKQEALGSLDQLDKAIDAASSLIGPGAGRISHIEQLIGNPDPRISALGTKLLLTKMQVDHAATGTVRAGASPQLLARWDNLMSQNLTPENLKAAVQAMREILGGGGAGSGLVNMIAPDGGTLSVPPDKVAELEKLGAKRR